MKTRTIVAEQIPVSAGVLLAGGVRQFRWKKPDWAKGLYRVYLDGRLAAVTSQTWHNFHDAEGVEWEFAGRVEVYVELADTRG